MKAITIHEFGGIDKLLYEDLEVPKPGNGQVLVKIFASGVNHLDHDLREGISGIDVKFPHVLGVEGVGEIVELGGGVNQSSLGDRVAIHFAQGNPRSDMWLSGLDGVDFSHGRIGASRWGTHSEYCVAEETSLIDLPENISYEKGEFPWAASGKALIVKANQGKTKILFDPETKKILGAAIVGPSAGDLISEACLAMEMGADSEDISLTIHPHPTLGETFAAASEAYSGTITDLYIPQKREK